MLKKGVELGQLYTTHKNKALLIKQVMCNACMCTIYCLGFVLTRKQVWVEEGSRCGWRKGAGVGRGREQVWVEGGRDGGRREGIHLIHDTAPNVC